MGKTFSILFIVVEREDIGYLLVVLEREGGRRQSKIEDFQSEENARF